MKNTIYYSILGAFGVVGGAIASALGGFDMVLKILVSLMAIDYFTGVVIAAVWQKSPKTVNGALESHHSIKGLFRKMGMLLCVYICVMLDAVTGSDYIRNTAIMFFIGNEGISVMENLGVMGVNYPPFIKNAFEVLRDHTKDVKVETDKK